MKRVGILTFPHSPSFGASLQMYALYTAVQELGFDPEIINYVNQYMQSESHIRKTSRIKRMLISVFAYHSRLMFSRFEKQLVHYPKNTIHDKESLSDLNLRYDFMICGSDQVWNPLITGSDYSYLFDFCTNDNKKISYAPSFGLKELPENVKEKYAKLISLFKKISVRERHGAEIVKDLTGIDPEIVVDPSMLLTREQWEGVMMPFRKTPSHYIVKFIFNECDYVNSFCKSISEKTGYPLLTIGGIGPKKNINNGYTGPIGPQEWLYIIHNADSVITDSFHGAAFSIIFNKDVYISLESSTKSRLEMLVEIFELESKVIAQSAVPSSAKINYDAINAIREDKRNKSIEFLRKSLR